MSARINFVMHLGSILKFMGVYIDSEETTMAILNGLPVENESLISTIDALEYDKNLFTLDLIKTRLLQEEQRKEIRNRNTIEAALITAARIQRFSRTALVCFHAKRRRHRESTCWDKYLSLRPNQNSVPNHKDQNQALLCRKYSR